jgi:glycosyltransferase involved in cell wall biosynthesis
LEHYLIVIPAFNEEEHIADVLEAVKESNPHMDILVVNDGSMDATSDIARQKGAKVLDIPLNIGYGGAIQTGFRFAVEYGYDFVVTLDADGQHDPESVNVLIETLKREKVDVVIGSRFFEGSYRMGILRRIGARLFSVIARLYIGAKISDPTSGFQLLSRKVFSHLSKDDNYPLDYPDVNIIMALHKMNFKIIEAPARMREKLRGKSMHSGLRPVVYVLRMCLAILMVFIRKEE